MKDEDFPLKVLHSHLCLTHIERQRDKNTCKHNNLQLDSKQKAIQNQTEMKILESKESTQYSTIYYHLVAGNPSKKTLYSTYPY